MLILAPWFGEVERFRPMAEAWTERCAANWDDAPIFLTDGPKSGPTPFKDVVRPDQPFDVKGALVCGALLDYDQDLLVLDLDAMLCKDPGPALSPFEDCPIAMPLDHGAITHDRRGTLEVPYQDVKKLCAGVMYFGKTMPVIRRGLVDNYRAAWKELLPILPWRPALPHLLEQYAWSLACHRTGGEMLPHAFNWNPDHLGPNPRAIVEHRYGFWKWRG